MFFNNRKLLKRVAVIVSITIVLALLAGIILPSIV